MNTFYNTYTKLNTGYVRFISLREHSALLRALLQSLRGVNVHCAVDRALLCIALATIVDIMFDSRHLFTTVCGDLPPPENPSNQRIALDKAFQDLSDEYERNWGPVSGTYLVCDFSSNHMTLAHLE